MPKRLFGTAGIRGITNTEITPDLALQIAVCWGDWLNRQKGTAKVQTAVGHDTRYGAEMLARIAAGGLASSGCHVHFTGCVPTGVFSMFLARNKLEGGILITGSHMPPDRIGIVCMLGDGAYIPVEISDPIEEAYRNYDRAAHRTKPEEIGRIEEAFHPFELYIAETVQQVDTPPIKDRRFKILIDPANGTASLVAKQLFEWFGCTVEMIHFDPNPVPARPSEPRAATVGEAIRKVRELNVDLGLCLDVDADRALFITADGEPVSEDTTGAIFAREELRAEETCVVPINSSGLIELVCEQNKAHLQYCEVGQPPTVKAIKALGAAYAYEESGKYYFPKQNLWCDGLFSGVKMLEIMARRRITLAALAAQFPRFHQVKHTLHVKEETKEPLMRRLGELLASTSQKEVTRTVTIDGYKRMYRDHSWLLIRASGTEPLIRVYADAPSLERAKELVRWGENILRQAQTSP